MLAIAAPLEGRPRGPADLKYKGAVAKAAAAAASYFTLLLPLPATLLLPLPAIAAAASGGQLRYVLLHAASCCVKRCCCCCCCCCTPPTAAGPMRLYCTVLFRGRGTIQCNTTTCPPRPGRWGCIALYCSAAAEQYSAIQPHGRVGHGHGVVVLHRCIVAANPPTHSGSWFLVRNKKHISCVYYFFRKKI